MCLYIVRCQENPKWSNIFWQFPKHLFPRNDVPLAEVLLSQTLSAASWFMPHDGTKPAYKYKVFPSLWCSRTTFYDNTTYCTDNAIVWGILSDESSTLTLSYYTMVYSTGITNGVQRKTPVNSLLKSLKWWL